MKLISKLGDLKCNCIALQLVTDIQNLSFIYIEDGSWKKY